MVTQSNDYAIGYYLFYYWIFKLRKLFIKLEKYYKSEISQLFLGKFWHSLGFGQSLQVGPNVPSLACKNSIRLKIV